MKSYLIEALPENRAGLMSLAQRLRIAAQIPKWIVVLLVFLAAFTSVPVTQGPFWWVVIGPCEAAMVAWIGSTIYCHGRDCFGGSAATLDGILRRHDLDTNSTTLIFDSERIVGGPGGGGLIVGERYRIYFTPRGKRLLNAELLDKGVTALNPDGGA